MIRSGGKEKASSLSAPREDSFAAPAARQKDERSERSDRSHRKRPGTRLSKGGSPCSTRTTSPVGSVMSRTNIMEITDNSEKKELYPSPEKITKGQAGRPSSIHEYVGLAKARVKRLRPRGNYWRFER